MRKIEDYKLFVLFILNGAVPLHNSLQDNLEWMAFIV